jgi:acyl carrier protein
MPDPNPACDSILIELQEWLLNRTGASVAPDRGFVEEAGLDSFDVMEMVIHMEGRFGVRFRTEDFADPGFVTLGGLAAIIQARLGASGVGLNP